ncbi:MAG: hypothetical protein P9M15_05995 [Candidatus Electryoneaceae bacterium]|nr:hypothetical protein [Candidatus Electryoneaceae bacterium]
MKWIKICVIIFSIMAVYQTDLYADITNSQQRELYRMARSARSAESNGQLERALDLWRFISDRKPSDVSAYNGVQRCLIGLNRFDDALSFLDSTLVTSRLRQTRFSPITVTADRIGVLFVAGQDDQAQAAIAEMLMEFRGDPKTYKEAAQILFAQRFDDEALDTYRRGRQECSNPHLFAKEMAYYCEARMDWETAVTEYLLYLEDSPSRLRYVTGAIGDMPVQLGADSVATTVILQYRSQSSPNFQLVLSQLLADLHFRSQRYEQAFDMYIFIDSVGDGRGEKLLEFAQMLLDEGEIPLAQHTYNTILTLDAPQNVQLRALLGKGRTAEALNMPDSAVVTPDTRTERYATTALSGVKYARQCGCSISFSSCVRCHAGNII